MKRKAAAQTSLFPEPKPAKHITIQAPPKEPVVIKERTVTTIRLDPETGELTLDCTSDETLTERYIREHPPTSKDAIISSIERPRKKKGSDESAFDAAQRARRIYAQLIDTEVGRALLSAIEDLREHDRLIVHRGETVRGAEGDYYVRWYEHTRPDLVEAKRRASEAFFAAAVPMGLMPGDSHVIGLLLPRARYSYDD